MQNPFPACWSTNTSSNSMAPMIRALLVLGFAITQMGAATPFDFTQAGPLERWNAGNDIGQMRMTPEGLAIQISGNDPAVESPPLAAAYPTPIYVHVRLKSEVGGQAQLFWTTSQYSENQSVWFNVKGNAWTDVCVPLPPLEKRTRFRFDPPGAKGSCVIAWMRIEKVDTTGITRVAATQDQLELTIRGLTGEFDVVELEPNQSLSETATAPVVHHGKLEVAGIFKIPRFETSGDVSRDRIYSSFVALQQHRKLGNVPVGPLRFVEEFTNVSKYDTPFPAAKSKKGLQVAMADDAIKLGVQHAAILIDLTNMVDLTGGPGSLEWTMDGKTYSFNRKYVEGLMAKKLSDAGCTVTVILLAYESGKADVDAVMLHPRHTVPLPQHLAAFNTVTPEGMNYYKASIEFLADRFSRPDQEFGRVANYVIGNEVDGHWGWYNFGPMQCEPAVEEYERAVRIAHTAIRKHSSSSRIYLSLTQHWNVMADTNPTKATTARRFLEEYNRRTKMSGDYDWNLAFHPYPENLFQPRTWLDKTALPNLDTPKITFKNIDQLTKFFHKPEMLCKGQVRRIILSEQGFHSDDTPAGDIAQAAAYCYAWVKIKNNDEIDSFILHRHVDHSGEGKLNLGLWRRQPDSVSNPSTPRPMYDVFQKADTPEWEEAFKFALPIIGIRSWKELSK